MAKTMNRIIKIFMERDGDTYEEALSNFQSLQLSLKSLLEECDNGYEAYEYMEDELALYDLEPDYIEDLIF